MNRRVFRSCLITACLVASAAPAAAGDWWDAMEAWSGPGPFGHRYGNFFGTVCQDTARIRKFEDDHRKWESSDRRTPEPQAPKLPVRVANEYVDRADLDAHLTGRPKTCAYLNFATYRVEKDPVKGYDAVDLQAYDFGLLFEVRRGFDVGFGAGWINTESRGVHSTKFAITPIRVAIRPVCFIVNCGRIEEGRRAANHWARVLTFTAHERWLPQGVSSADFGAPEVDYSVDEDWLTSGGLLTFDIGELVAAIKAMRAPR